MASYQRIEEVPQASQMELLGGRGVVELVEIARDVPGRNLGQLASKALAVPHELPHGSLVSQAGVWIAYLGEDELFPGKLRCWSLLMEQGGQTRIGSRKFRQAR